MSLIRIVVLLWALSEASFSAGKQVNPVKIWPDNNRKCDFDTLCCKMWMTVSWRCTAEWVALAFVHIHCQTLSLVLMTAQPRVLITVAMVKSRKSGKTHMGCNQAITVNHSDSRPEVWGRKNCCACAGRSYPLAVFWLIVYSLHLCEVPLDNFCCELAQYKWNWFAYSQGMTWRIWGQCASETIILAGQIPNITLGLQGNVEIVRQLI